MEESLREWRGGADDIARMVGKKAVVSTGLGEIILGFFPQDAPNHVSIFLELVQGGYYNETLIHRVVPGFVIQSGDPNTREGDRDRFGLGGPGYYLKAEINERCHLRGTLAMARSASLDSAGSQFFVNLEDNPSLDGQYTVFGEVLEGMDVIERIAMEARDERDIPLEDVPITIKVVEQS